MALLYIIDVVLSFVGRNSVVKLHRFVSTLANLLAARACFVTLHDALQTKAVLVLIACHLNVDNARSSLGLHFSYSPMLFYKSMYCYS